MKPKPKKQSMRWTDVERGYIMDNWKVATEEEIAETIGRIKAAVVAQAYTLGLATPVNKWTKWEQAYLEDNWNAKTPGEIAECLGRTKKAVETRARKCGLSWSDNDADAARVSLPPLQPVTRSWAETTAELRELLGV